jgi:hypothetical protein
MRNSWQQSNSNLGTDNFDSSVFQAAWGGRGEVGVEAGQGQKALESETEIEIEL